MRIVTLRRRLYGRRVGTRARVPLVARKRIFDVEDIYLCNGGHSLRLIFLYVVETIVRIVISEVYEDSLEREGEVCTFDTK